MTAATLDLLIEQGKTFTKVLRWEALPVVYRPIAAISQAAPARITTAAPHGLTNGWRAAVTGALGMTKINASNTPPRSSDYHRVTVIDSLNVEFNDVNAAGFLRYTSGGVLTYNTAVPLAGYTARMSIKDVIGGIELLRLDTVAGRIVVDATAATITLTIDAITSAAIAWTTGVYDLELVSAGGVVTALVQGNVSVTPEVTTT